MMLAAAGVLDTLAGIALEEDTEGAEFVLTDLTSD